MSREAVRLEMNDPEDSPRLPRQSRPQQQRRSSCSLQQAVTLCLLLLIAWLLFISNLNQKEILKSNEQLRVEGLKRDERDSQMLQSLQTMAQTQNNQLATLQHQGTLKQNQLELAQQQNQLSQGSNNLLNTIMQQQIEQTEKLQRQIEGSAWFDHRVGYEHKHQRLTFNYSTLGQPTPNEQFDFTPLTQEDLYGFEKQLAIWFRPYNDTNCKYKRIGPADDGGYVMCENFINKSEALINLGVQDRDDFGCHFTSYRKVPNYMYDCTSELKPHCALNDDQNTFYHTCAGDVTQYQTKSFETLKDMVDKNNLTNKHISLKVDIEGAQMVAFRHFPTQYLQYVDQIVMEYHPADQWLWPGSPTQAYGFSHAKFKGNLQIWKTISEHFHCVNWHYTNNACYDLPARKGNDLANQHWFRSSTVEFSFVNKKLLKVNKPTRSFVWPHKENAENFPIYLTPEKNHNCDYRKGDDPDPNLD